MQHNLSRMFFDFFRGSAVTCQRRQRGWNLMEMSARVKGFFRLFPKKTSNRITYCFHCINLGRSQPEKSVSSVFFYRPRTSLSEVHQRASTLSWWCLADGSLFLGDEPAIAQGLDPVGPRALARLAMNPDEKESRCGTTNHERHHTASMIM